MLEIVDTAGAEQFSSLREQYMREARAFLLVFGLNSTSSFDELASLREQIVQTKCNDPRIPIVLVGNKADLESDRTSLNSNASATSEAWGKVPYYETIAKSGQNVMEIFVDICRQVLRDDLSRQSHRTLHREHRDRGRRCTIL